MVAGEQLVFTTPVGESKFAGGHWLATARRWNQIGPPLRPSPEDIGFYSAAIDRWVLTNGSPRALILGVTPELYRLSWPNGTNLLAVDRTRGMIDAIWPGPRNAVMCADWTAMPLPAHSRDIALCDAGLLLVPFPHGLSNVVRILHRVLTSGGLFVTRLFLPPTQLESPDVVLRDLLAGSIANLNILKMRLGMALQESSEEGVQLGRIWDVLNRAVPNLPRLVERIGWPLETLSAIDIYRNCSSVYHFSSFAEIRHLFCDDPGGFTCASIDVPGYLLGERCPTVVFRRESK